mgnify:CR=1 FL=1
MSDENWDDYVDRHSTLYHSMPYVTKNYYMHYEKGIRLLQSLYRMYLWNHKRNFYTYIIKKYYAK